MAKTISIEALDSAISKMLNSYVDQIADGTDDATEKVAKQCLKEIKAASPVRTGKYKKGWKKKLTNQTRGHYEYTIYNEHPGLPHLLEHGHAKVGGGRVEGKPHIAPATERAITTLQQEIQKVIQDATPRD